MNQNDNYGFLYIKYLVSMNYVEATQRKEECMTISFGKPYKFKHRLYVVSTKVLACRNIPIPMHSNRRDNTKGVFMGKSWGAT